MGGTHVTYFPFPTFSGSPNSYTEGTRVDPLVKLFSTVLHLADIEKRALSSNMAHILSPQVGGTLVWFLQHWARSYLLPDEREYDQLSITLLTIFGQNTEGGKWMVGFLLGKVQSNLVSWVAEPQLAEDTAMLLLSLVDSKRKYVDITYGLLSVP